MKLNLGGDDEGLDGTAGTDDDDDDGDNSVIENENVGEANSAKKEGVPSAYNTEARVSVTGTGEPDNLNLSVEVFGIQRSSQNQ
ncbi:hypothetical protein GH714_019480 [Hevea brasiliensis]|uniref:Uncharacterized protein n=1 Tax=Hevea brasiliensis TaxID=3981 RepID=A0A6A6KSP3_HEVBR|nr:hypothetical protein GH714_019480 [Hevea brasiliensis]